LSQYFNLYLRAPELKTRKNDLIIWVYLSELQLKLYQGFVNSDRVKQVSGYKIYNNWC